MLYILVGEDDFSLRQSLEEIKSGFSDQALLATNTTTLNGQQLTLDQLRTVCETTPFLAERRLVIVNGLLKRFESKNKSGRQKKSTPVSDQQNEYKSLAVYLSKIPESIILVLIDVSLRSISPLFRELAAKAEVRSFSPLRGAELRQWIQKHVAKEGGSISREAINLLTRLVGGNLWTMSSEINKLALFASGRRIEEEDIKMVVSHTQETNAFAMIDAILELKGGLAERLLQQLLQRGATSAYLLVMLSRQVRMIVRVKGLRNRGIAGTEIQRRLGLTSDFALRKTLEQADKYSLARLREIYHKLLEADLAIKAGKFEGELTLNILLAELCQPHRV